MARRDREPGLRAAGAELIRRHPGGQARHLVAAPHRRAAARRRRTAGPPRVRRSSTRRWPTASATSTISSSRIADDADGLPGPRHRHPRRAPGQRLEPARTRSSKADRGHRHALRSAHRADRALRHERAAAAPARRRRRRSSGGSSASWSGRRSRCSGLVPAVGLVRERGTHPTSCPTTSPIRSPPARSSSARRRSSRSWSRTPSTPRRTPDRRSPIEYGGKRLIRVEDDGDRHGRRTMRG